MSGVRTLCEITHYRAALSKYSLFQENKQLDHSNFSYFLWTVYDKGYSLLIILKLEKTSDQAYVVKNLIYGCPQTKTVESFTFLFHKYPSQLSGRIIFKPPPACSIFTKYLVKNKTCKNTVGRNRIDSPPKFTRKESNNL